MQQQHGSGKTAVLVERIINKVINENVDIDKILIVTFTNAAASEMRERILDAIYKKLEENPASVNLQRQINLLNKASICTIHSFCLDVIRNNFYEIDASANFRIGDTAEIEMLKSDALEEIFEQKYMDNDKDFIKLIETYTDYRGDEKLQEIILNIYKYIQSNPFPEKWLNEKVEEFNVDVEKDFAETTWGKIILANVQEKVQDMILRLEKIKSETLRFTELEKFSLVLQDDINNLQSIKYDNWDLAFDTMNGISWAKWPVDKKVTLELKNEAKDIRDKIKKEFSGAILQYNSKEANEDISAMYGILDVLRKLILEFTSEFAKKKKEKNIIDFNDIEHFALKILVNEDGEKTEVAKKYMSKFEEILIDEYQDSNLVQEKILTSISKGNNIFMVGDVKQSIYKFRQARPELFLEKYANYDTKDGLLEKHANKNILPANHAQYDTKSGQNVDSTGLKIQLFKNFRSRKNVLDITNLVFENIMSKELGNVEYNEEEYLNLGADYPNPDEKVDYAGIAELHIIDLKEKEEDYYKTVDNEDGALAGEKNSIETNDRENDNKSIKENIGIQIKESLSNEEIEEERIEDSVLEARFVAKKIQELLQSNYHVYDKKKKAYRKVMAKDICVLLRATSVLAPIYEKEIEELNIPVFSDSSNTYLETMEVQTIMAMLKVIDNPMQDIPLVTVLRSNIFGFTDNDLIQIRLSDKKCSFYESMLKAKLSVDNRLRAKIDNTILQIEKWKAEEKYTPLNEFIWKIYLDTGFYDYVSLLPNGDLRQANLKLLFEKAKQYEKASFKGLYNFINFIDKVKTSSGDASSAKIIGENDNVVRIMSIHKSKGLEFPVVFLASTGKKFNMQDLNTPILLHQDIGFGMQFIDSEKRIEYSTLSKEAIRISSKQETISEEMRVLYVALTRAKEKLIITGMCRDLEKALKDKEKVLDIYKKSDAFQISLDNVARVERPDFKINKNAVQKYTSYLDWLELVYEYNKENGIRNVIDLHTYNKADLIKQIQREENETIDMAKVIKEKANAVNKRNSENQLSASSQERDVNIGNFMNSIENLKNDIKIQQGIMHTEEMTSERQINLDEMQIKKLLEWKYEYIASSKIPTKTSVTKLKEMEQESDIDDLIEMARNRISIEKKDNESETVLNGKYLKEEVIDDKENIENEHIANKKPEEKTLRNEGIVKESEKSNAQSTEKYNRLTAKPKFMEKVQKLTAAQKGTLIHLCVQKLDEKKDYTEEDLHEFVLDLKNRNIISEREAESINIELLYKYTKSELWRELKQAKEIHKEEPFYINVPAREIFDEAAEDEMILVQGIIDLYYIDTDGRLILVDYKTDYVPDGDVSKLEEKYKVQLDLYKKALEGALNQRIDKAMIWALNK